MSGWNKSGYETIRREGFMTTTYFYSQYIALFFDPSARLYCGDNDDKSKKKRQTRAEKKEASYRQMIRIE